MQKIYLMRNLRNLTFALVYFVTTSNLYAQKLPKIQTVSQRAPNNIKIDGKTTEWNDKFLAYNVNNHIYYTISNDETYLYLTTRTNDGYSSEKMLFGLTFSIKSQQKQSISVTYPSQVLPAKIFPFRRFATIVRESKNDKTISKVKLDSLRSVANSTIDNVFNTIDIAGIKEINDPSLPIDNSSGIKVCARFDENMYYVYELAIPIKYFEKAIGVGQKIKYNITLNGLPRVSINGAPTPTVDRNFDSTAEYDNSFVSFPTDFSGEYTFTK